MSLQACLDEAVKGGEIDKTEAEYLANRYQGYKAARETGGPAGAEEQARLDLIESLEAEAAEKRRRAKIALRHIKKLERDLIAHVDPKGKAHIGEAGIFLMEHNGEAKFSSYAGREKTIIAQAHARLENLLFEFRRGAFGGDLTRHNPAKLQNVVKELFGEDTKDASAKGLASAWADTAEWLRVRFNKSGGAIGKLENWGMPQSHDARALLSAGRKKWKEYIIPSLDLESMKHPLTGKQINPYELDAVLDDVWDSIVTQGWNKREPKRQAFGKGALSSQRTESRFLVFKDAENWMQYQKDFGGAADPFSAMMEHINGMAKDIAALEVLGPNPDGTLNWLKQRVSKEAANYEIGKTARWTGDRKKALEKANSYNVRIEQIYDSIRGTSNSPVNSVVADIMGNVRNWITASVLGSAAISAISDVGTHAIARKFAFAHEGSLAAQSAVVIKETAQAFKTGTKREAVEAGLILDSAQHAFQQQARYAGTLSGRGFTSFLADRVLTFSGLTPWTQAGRHAFGLAFMNEAAKLTSRTFEEMPAAMRRTFGRYGITADDWKIIRKAKVHNGQGLRLLRPNEIEKSGGERLAERYLEMTLTETEFAIPSGTHRSRTLLKGNTRPGTFIGEAINSFAMFKSFGAVFVILHGGRLRGMFETEGLFSASGWRYAGSLLASTMLFGGLAMQLKEIAAGREPRDMNSTEFWGGALLQGGGLGIYGDFFFADVNRYGGGLPTTLAGPVVQRADDLRNLAWGNFVQFWTGENTNIGRELVKLARGNIPGSNIWYLRRAWETNVLDQMQMLTDPEAQKAFRRKQKFWQREFGQEFFWKPGQRVPFSQ